MRDIASLLNSLGGIAQKQQLVAHGARDLDLTGAVKSGSVIRARQGWYTTLPAMDPRVRAVRVGGRLTGISAVQQAGGWVLGRHPLHVSVPDNAARLRSQTNRRVRFDHEAPDGVELHWDGEAVGECGTAWSVDICDALHRVILDEDLETAVAALDWALHTRAIDRIDFESLLLSLPGDYRELGRWVDDLCGSLPESLSRTRLRLRGHRVESQVAVGALRSIDLVVDDCVGLETDGEEFHLDRFESDRSKDLDITIARMHGLRASARAVFRDWDRVLLAIETAVSTHVDALAFGNSGQLPCDAVRVPGNRRRRRLRPRKSPEFPKGRGNTGGRVALRST